MLLSLKEFYQYGQNKDGEKWRRNRHARPRETCARDVEIGADQMAQPRECSAISRGLGRSHIFRPSKIFNSLDTII